MALDLGVAGGNFLEQPEVWRVWYDLVFFLNSSCVVGMVLRNSVEPERWQMNHHQSCGACPEGLYSLQPGLLFPDLSQVATHSIVRLPIKPSYLQMSYGPPGVGPYGNVDHDW